VDGFLYDKGHNPWAGVVSMAVGMIVSIWLFSNQSEYVGPVPTNIPSFGDSTFEVGFVVAAVLYAILFQFQRDKDIEEAAVVA
jgi:cytosine/uracil/thiamine/allantoin permease